MNSGLKVTVGVFIAALFGSAHGETSLRETRSTLEKWVEIRQLISKTRSDWQTDKETLQQTAELYQRELAAVDQQMGKISTNNAQVDKERVEAEALKSSSSASLERAKGFALQFEKKITALAAQMPVPLQDTLKPLLNRLPADPSSKMSAPERLQVIVGILNEIDKFNSAVSVFSEKRKNSKGEEVAVETVYIGLGSAYFVNDKGDFAGTGSPGATGWEWTTKPELASSVREVIRIYRNERPATFVSLPVTLH
jgi:hypothetical protein